MKDQARSEFELACLVDRARIAKNELGDFKGAIKLCEQILKLDPENRDAMLIKAGALSQLHRFNEFIDLNKRIIEMWPAHWEAYYLQAMFHFSLNEDDSALELINRSIERNENFNNIIMKAQMLCLMGNPEYRIFLKRSKIIDAARAENFRKHHWIDKMEDVKPTVLEWLKGWIAAKRLTGKKGL